MAHLTRSISLGIVAGCLVALALPTPAPAAADELQALRARGPAGLATLLARYDAMAPGPQRDHLEREIDTVAGQRYAAVSRLYWYTDLDRARAAAAAQQRPILHLRMLGRLDEELSCANSRLFRTTLYANTEVAKLLRENFVLSWSTERPVPRVTIDFGDGRKLERTTTGNSAHYVLDERGAVLDVLPGLYAPTAFRAELVQTLALAARLRGLDAPARDRALAQFHEAGLERTRAAFAPFARAAATRALAGTNNLPPRSAVRRAQDTAVSKARMEMPDLARMGFDTGAIPEDDVAQWAVIGEQVWATGAARPGKRRVLDATSRALVVRLHTAGQAAEPREIERMLTRLEQAILADTARNQFRHRPRIREQLVDARAPAFDALNAWIYAAVFETPQTDPWLGLLPRTDFTGLPGDGVVTR